MEKTYMDTQIRPKTNEEIETDRQRQLRLNDTLAYLRRKRELILDDLEAVDLKIEQIEIELSQPIWGNNYEQFWNTTTTTRYP